MNKKIKELKIVGYETKTITVPLFKNSTVKKNKQKKLNIQLALTIDSPQKS